MREMFVSEDLPHFPEWLDRTTLPEEFIAGKYYDVGLWTYISGFVVIIGCGDVRYRRAITTKYMYYHDHSLGEWKKLDVSIEEFKNNPEKYIMEIIL